MRGSDIIINSKRYSGDLYGNREDTYSREAIQYTNSFIGRRVLMSSIGKYDTFWHRGNKVFE